MGRAGPPWAFRTPKELSAASPPLIGSVPDSLVTGEVHEHRRVRQCVCRLFITHHNAGHTQVCRMQGRTNQYILFGPASCFVDDESLGQSGKCSNALRSLCLSVSCPDHMAAVGSRVHWVQGGL